MKLTVSFMLVFFSSLFLFLKEVEAMLSFRVEKFYRS